MSSYRKVSILTGIVAGVGIIFKIIAGSVFGIMSAGVSTHLLFGMLVVAVFAEKTDAARPYLAPCFSILYVVQTVTSLPSMIQYSGWWAIAVRVCLMAVNILLCVAFFKHKLRLREICVALYVILLIGQSFLFLGSGTTPFILNLVQNTIMSVAVVDAYCFLRKKKYLDMVDSLRAVKAQFAQNQLSETEYDSRVEEILSAL